MSEATLTEEDLHVLRHMLGIDDARKPPRPYRDHYCTWPADERLTRLEALGLVRIARDPDLTIPYVTYSTTEAGRAAAMESAERRLIPKRKRIYSRFLDVRDACPDLTFREFLTSPDYAEARRDAPDPRCLTLEEWADRIERGERYCTCGDALAPNEATKCTRRVEGES